ncbi:hypothetical protein E0Z10_g100 [Xylaria hypoxylon]|uniref:Uncharacterized protein n=1 Tax=Xylaria hypoxylon TaxID=37992 RepID=A0A4Z0YX66_9PEZI|nr:hypothetical protein E0Z10_g100 [Xylaria hypoxylon]
MDDASNDANPTELAGDIYNKIRGSRKRNSKQNQKIEEEMRGKNRHDDYMRQLPRRWRAGDVYSPHDMSPSETAKWRKNTARQKDLVDLLGLRPLDMYRGPGVGENDVGLKLENFSVISEFMTPHGRIKRSVETGLNPVNQPYTDTPRY